MGRLVKVVYEGDIAFQFADLTLLADRLANHAELQHLLKVNHSQLIAFQRTDFKIEEMMQSLTQGLYQFDCFMSHDWKGNNGKEHELVKQINSFLTEEKSLVTWFDEKEMKDDINSAMADGIDGSKLVVVFVTKEYMEKINGNNNNDNCKREYGYAIQKKNGVAGVIFVAMDEFSRNPTNWTGKFLFMAGSPLFIDLSPALGNGVERKKNLEGLFQKIKEKL